MSQLPHLLIVDSSKVVRASLARSLKASFETCEESNGESAWQTLILDTSIAVVIVAVSLPKLDGFGLLERVRANKLGRLKNIPFFLIASDSMGDDIRQQALACGVSGFIPKSAGRADAIRIVESFLAPTREAGLAADSSASGLGDGLAVSDVFGPLEKLAGINSRRTSGSRRDVTMASPVLVPRVSVEARLNTLLTTRTRVKGIGVLAFGMDGYHQLVEQFGQKMANRIECKFVQLLGGKLRAEDRIAQIAADRIVIVAPETNLKLCMAFAERICKRLAASKVSVGGQRVEMTVSVGVACFANDGADLLGDELLSTAELHLELAVNKGGNQVVGGSISGALQNEQEKALRPFKELLGAGSVDALEPHLGQVGLLLLPLLERLESSFDLGLPIEKMAQLFQERAGSEMTQR